MTITLEQSHRTYQGKRANEQKRHIKSFDEDDKLELLNGSMVLTSPTMARTTAFPRQSRECRGLTYEECMTIIKEAPEPKARGQKK